MQKAEKRFSLIVKRLKSSDLGNKDTICLKILERLGKSKQSTQKCAYVGLAVIIIALLIAAAVLMAILQVAECLIEMPIDASKVFRRPENCKICEGVTEVDKVRNISGVEFEELYTTTSKPVVVIDGTRGWLANQEFTFEFFRNLYLNGGTEEKFSCQFFPYKTEFKTLKDALNMSFERSRLLEGEKPWYIGWSNCNDEAGKVLRRYYKAPYFLPGTSENMGLAWIFMGGPGFGAHLHVDNVQYPSWQAQITGRKQWRLAPPPECTYVCKELTVIVEPSEMIVVDTNRWYHQTLVLSGGISITIGSEFD